MVEHFPGTKAEEWMERVEQNADADWKRIAAQVTRQVAVLRPEFTTDAIWYVLGRDHPEKSTHEHRAMGAIMQRAERHGWVAPTDKYARSARPECHGRPVRVWKSLIHG